jgi:hypothetical protein
MRRASNGNQYAAVVSSVDGILSRQFFEVISVVSQDCHLFHCRKFQLRGITLAYLARLLSGQRRECSRPNELRDKNADVLIEI